MKVHHRNAIKISILEKHVKTREGNINTYSKLDLFIWINKP